MIERSAVAMYAVSAGMALAFYVGPFRHASAIMASNATATMHDEATLAEDRKLLQRAAALRSLQRRVEKEMRSPLQAGSSGKRQALFFDRLRSLSRREQIVVTTIMQGERASVDSRKLLSISPISVTAVGKLSGILRFLSAIDATVGIVDLGRLEFHPAGFAGKNANTVAVRVDGTFLKVDQTKAGAQ